MIDFEIKLVGSDILKHLGKSLFSMQYKLEVSFWNWRKPNNQGLCDFKEVSKEAPLKFKLQGTGVIYRNVSDFSLQFVCIEDIPPTGIIDRKEPLILIRQMNDTHKVVDLKSQQQLPQPLTVLAPRLSEEPQRTLRISKGSIFRLGKAIIEVIKVQADIQQETQNLYQKEEKSLIGSIKNISMSNYEVLSKGIPKTLREMSVDSEQEDEQIDVTIKQYNFSIYAQNPMCKICLSRTIEKENSLVSLCKCKGSSKFIHEKCLSFWVKTRSQQQSFKRNGKQAIFKGNMKGFKCEVCKQYYSLNYVHKLMLNEHFDSVTKYITLLAKFEGNEEIFIVDLESVPEIKIGRDLENDVIIGELTASRNHCVIKYSSAKKSIEIADLSSKFGTLIKKPSFFLTQNFYKLQKGRTYFEIHKSKKSEQRGFLDKLFICLPQSF